MSSTLFDSLRGLSWPSRRRAVGTLPGNHRSRLRGTAPELSEYQLYRQGDDPRQLDWKLLARSDRAYIRLAEDRSLLATWFIVDASASMAFPADTLAKWRLAVDVTLGLASVALSSGDPVGLLIAHHAAPLQGPRASSMRDAATPSAGPASALRKANIRKPRARRADSKSAAASDRRAACTSGARFAVRFRAFHTTACFR